MDPMKCLTIFLLLPVFLYAQPFDNWLTPFATVEFEEEYINYRFTMIDPNCSLKPAIIPKAAIRFLPAPSYAVSCQEISQGIRELGDYIENPANPANDYSDRMRYLKAFALQTILALGREGLPSPVAQDKIRQMIHSPAQDISSLAERVATLYRQVQNALTDHFGREKYISYTGLSNPVPVMFSTETLISDQTTGKDDFGSDSMVWPKYYGEPTRKEFSHDIEETYDKGYVVMGNYLSPNNVQKASWLIKTDINGDTLWEKVLSNNAYNKSWALEQTMDGGLLICGGLRRAGNAFDDPFVVKLNACGEKEWCRIFEAAMSIFPWAVDAKETPTGDVILLVNQYGVSPQETLHLFKLSGNGEVLWKNPYASGFVHPLGAYPFGWKITITPDGKYLIAGKIYWPDPWNPGGVKILRPLFISVNAAGEEEWILPFGLNDTIYGTGDDIFVLNNTCLLGVGSYWPDSPYVEPLLMKIDMSGQELDHKILYTSSIVPELAGGSFVYGFMIDSLLYAGGVYAFPNNLGYPILESKFLFDTTDFSFTPIINRIDSLHTSSYTFNKTSKSKFLSNSTRKQSGNWDIVLGKLNLNLEYDTLDPGFYTYDSLCTTPGLPQSGFIFLDDCDIITGIDIPSPEEYYARVQTIVITAYPNPAETEITLAFQNTEHHNNMLLECYNLFGQRVHSEKVYKGQQKTKLSIEQWQSGLYIAVIKSDGRVAGQVRFVKRGA
jgi:hypothetical protein